MKPSVTLPTVGRIVHYTNLGDRDGRFPPEIQAAIITKVYSETCVSLHIFYESGDFLMQKVEKTDWPAGSDEARGRWTWPARS